MPSIGYSKTVCFYVLLTMMGRFLIMFTFVAIVLHQFERQTPQKWELSAMEADSATVALKVAQGRDGYNAIDGRHEIAERCRKRRVAAAADREERKKERQTREEPSAAAMSLEGKSLEYFDANHPLRQKAYRPVSLADATHMHLHPLHMPFGSANLPSSAGTPSATRAGLSTRTPSKTWSLPSSSSTAAAFSSTRRHCRC